jgi:hypothetical protein
MNYKPRTKSGLSLMEEVVVVAAIALLIVFGIPAIRALYRSLEAEGGAHAMISGALSTARAIAAKEQRYAGIRFQNRYQPDGRGCQYMIFIVYEEPKKMGNLGNGFRAVDGYEPIKLPESVNVIDMMIRNDNVNPDCASAGDRDIGENDLDDTILERTMTDTGAFSIIFSPAGRLVIHDVRTRNRNGDYQPSTPALSGYDDIFNSLVNITNNNTGMFVQDDYADLGLGGEKSRQSFVIYDREEFKNLTDRTQRWDYLRILKRIFINPYTGTMIEK